MMFKYYFIVVLWLKILWFIKNGKISLISYWVNGIRHTRKGTPHDPMRNPLGNPLGINYPGRKYKQTCQTLWVETDQG